MRFLKLLFAKVFLSESEDYVEFAKCFSSKFVLKIIKHKRFFERFRVFLFDMQRFLFFVSSNHVEDSIRFFLANKICFSNFFAVWTTIVNNFQIRFYASAEDKRVHSIGRDECITFSCLFAFNRFTGQIVSALGITNIDRYYFCFGSVESPYNADYFYDAPTFEGDDCETSFRRSGCRYTFVFTRVPWVCHKTGFPLDEFYSIVYKSALHNPKYQNNRFRLEKWKTAKANIVRGIPENIWRRLNTSWAYEEIIEASRIFGGISRNKQLLHDLLPEFSTAY